MTALRSARRVVDVLTAHGVEYVFGVPGAKIDAVFDAVTDGGPQVVVCRHEQNATYGPTAPRRRLDFGLSGGTIEIATLTELHLSVPRTAAFRDAALNSADAADQIRRTEGGH